MAEVREVGEGVFAVHYDFLDQNIGVVVGSDRVLVIDTRSSHLQGRELQDDLRRLSAAPWVVLNTHHHWDHVFGNAMFRPGEVWGHRRCALRMLERSEEARRRFAVDLPSLAAELAELEVSPPDRTFGDDDEPAIDLGDRAVSVRYLGRGHTDDDVVAWLPDAGILFAGDLVEEGSPPHFGDSFPLEWPPTDRRLLGLEAKVVVPGHGLVVDARFVRAQLAELEDAAALVRQAHAEGRPAADAARGLPWAREPFGREFADRAYRSLG